MTDTLVDRFDREEFLGMLASRAAEFLEVTAAAVIATGETATVELAVGSSEAARLTALLQVRYSEGPGIEAFDRGAPVTCSDLADAPERWATFAPTAREFDYSAAHAFPMRLREQKVGALLAFDNRPGELTASMTELGGALATAATLGLLHHRALRGQAATAEQLKGTLSSKIRIEQAKGVLAERMQTTVDDAFATLRERARQQNLMLLDAAEAVLSDEIEPPDQR
nr:GAF and ANTAR domain-containing protein [Herbihabitans rhizosphaerae]